MADSTQAIEVLSAEECATVHRAVHQLRRHWEQRDPDLPFFTLGAASYLDAAQGQLASYREKAARLNPLLWLYFTWLYEKLAGLLERGQGRPFHFSPELALPGFHIFLPHPEFTKPRASMHYDLQHLNIPWEEPDMQRGPLSMTLAIRLPAAGAGLRLWNINYLELHTLAPEERKVHAATNRKATLERYSPGRMVLHSGYQLHQIAPAATLEPDDERLTLQAHAQPVREGYLLYW